MTHRALLLLAFAATASGCLGSALTGNDDGGMGGGGGGGGSGTGPADMSGDYVDKFYSQVQPILQPACGGCHGATGTTAPAFMLAMPDLLQNLLAYPGIIGTSPTTSRLYLKGQHEGPAFTPDQAPVIADWITFFNANRPAPMGDAGVSKPAVKPFTPVMGGTGGSNTIDLSVLDSTLAGQKLTFDAKMVGTSVQLSNIKIVAASTIGVHVVHPLFVVWDQNLTPTPDPVDSFSGLDQTVFSGQTATLGPGTLLLPSFAMGDLLNIVFTTVETKMGGGDGGTTTGCKALAMFVANVKPLLQANCNTCHVGATPTAGLAFDATPDATLCVNALTEIDKVTPVNSLLLKKPDPGANGDAAHPKKINPFTAFQTAVTNWINAEK